jgi:glycosyltransferase involved in cell wall biosynthesis
VRAGDTLDGSQPPLQMDAPRVRIGINGVALLSPLTGIGQYTRNLAEALLATGEVDLWLFYLVAWSQDIRSAPVPKMASLKSVVKKMVPYPYLVSRALQQIRFSRGLRNLGLQLYHEPNFLSHRFPGPTVITAHDLSWIRFPETHPAERVKLMNRVFPRSLEQAAHVITDAEFTRREIIEQFGIAPDRITSIPLAARNNFYPRSEDECRPVLAAQNLDYRSFILCVGTLEPRKNLDFVIRTYAAMPREFRARRPLVLAGMKGWLTSSLESVIQSLVASGEVRTLGFVSEDDLAMLYASASMLIYPSLYEGFGLPPLEAMSSGTPVIVSDRSTLPEVVGPAGVLIDPADAAGLRDAIRRLDEDRAYWDARRSACLRQAATFSWSRCARETIAIYRSVLACA